MERRVKSIGPLKAIGVVFNTVGTAANVIDRTVETSGNSLVATIESVSSLMDNAFEALELVTAGPLAELRADQVVRDAKLQVKIAKANAKAVRILAKLNPPTK